MNYYVVKFVICNACNSFLLFFVLAFNSTVLTKLHYPYIVNSKSHTTPYIVDSKSQFLLSMGSHLWQLKTTLLVHLIVQNDGKSFKNFDFEFLKYYPLFLLMSKFFPSLQMLKRFLKYLKKVMSSLCYDHKNFNFVCLSVLYTKSIKLIYLNFA